MRTVSGRLLSGLLILFLVSMLTFLFAESAPGDYLAEMRLDPRSSPQQVEVLRQRYGLDRPLAERYLGWLTAAFRGDLGTSFVRGAPVAPLVVDRLANTLLLVAPAWSLAWLLALVLGPWTAARPRKPASRWIRRGSALLLSLPQVVVALMALAFAARSGLLPVGGMSSLGAEDLPAAARLGDLARHQALPVLALVLHTAPVLLGQVRVAVGEQLGAPFVLSARARGLAAPRILWRHALPAAAGPLAPLAGLSFAGMVSGALLVEVVFAWPGLGPLMLEALLARDLPVAVAAILASGAVLLSANAAADLGLFLLDPRTRQPQAGLARDGKASAGQPQAEGSSP
jgi:peptide/nickel transport system permease protein